MKLIMENFRKFLSEEEEEDWSPISQRDQERYGLDWKGQPADPSGDKYNPPMSVPEQAFQNSDKDYLEKSIKQRTPGPGSAGSTFASAVSLEDLENADWTPYQHPNISSPAIGFKADIPGHLGIAKAKDLPPDQPVRFQPGHGGKAKVRDEESPKFDMVLAEVATSIPEANRQVGHTTLILGPSREDPKKLIVWTFFPGDPTPQLPDITMNDIKKEFGTEEDMIQGTIADAIRIGYTFVKHVDNVAEIHKPIHDKPKKYRARRVPIEHKPIKATQKQQTKRFDHMQPGWGEEL